MAFACQPDYCAHTGAVFGSDSCCLRPGFQFSLLVAARLAAAGVTVACIAARVSAASRRGGIRSGLASATVRTDSGLRRQRRRWTPDAHSRHSHSVMNDLVGLLVLCRQASGKTGKPQPSLAEIGARMHAAHRQPQAILQALGATPLQCADAPDLYAILLNIYDALDWSGCRSCFCCLRPA